MVRETLAVRSCPQRRAATTTGYSLNRVDDGASKDILWPSGCEPPTAVVPAHVNGGCGLCVELYVFRPGDGVLVTERDPVPRGQEVTPQGELCPAAVVQRDEIVEGRNGGEQVGMKGAALGDNVNGVDQASEQRKQLMLGMVVGEEMVGWYDLCSMWWSFSVGRGPGR